MSAAPLHGIRVIDFTTFLSGPFCTQMLGDMGADVVKVEPPAGDSSRTIPPHFLGPDSAYFISTNRNKRSIAIDLKSPQGLGVARRLVGTADVVVENFRPGVCAKLGLDPDTERERRPGLVWASISGFGQHGPWRDLPAYDMIVQALSGVMSLTGEPGRPAVRLGIPAGDIVAGMYAAVAILAALTDRSRSGKGRLIDVSMLDGQLSMLSYQAQYTLTAGVVPEAQAARHDSIATYRSFRAGDQRELVVTANTERMWQALCEALDLADLPRQARFRDQRSRLEHRDALWAILEPAFLTRPAVDWVSELSRRGVPAALIKTVPEALADARVHGRGMIMPVSHADGRHTDMVGTPIKFSDAEAPRVFPPTLSQHAAELMREIGYSDADIAAAAAAGAIAAVATTEEAVAADAGRTDASSDILAPAPLAP